MSFVRVFVLLLLSCLALSACSTGVFQAPWQAAKPTAENTPYAGVPSTAVPPAAIQPPRLVPVAPPLVQAGVQLTTPRRALLLLPMSGPHSTLGYQLMQAAQLALQDLAPDNFVLVPVDTASGAAAALQRALAQPADLIIGPLFSADVAATKGLATAAGIPMLALSNDMEQADSNTFLMGSGPAEQVARVLRFAAAQNLYRIVAIVPENAYGRAVTLALTNAVNPPQMLVQSLGYNPQSPDMAQLANALLRDVNSYDAVLLPDAPARAAPIAAALRTAGALQNERGAIRLLGSSQWDSGDADATAANIQPLSNGWFAAPDPAPRQQFTNRYLRTFGTAPPPVASLAYDATALAAVLASRNWPYTPAALTQAQGFAGMGGIFRLLPNGTVERSLAVQELNQSGRRILEMAPTRF